MYKIILFIDKGTVYNILSDIKQIILNLLIKDNKENEKCIKWNRCKKSLFIIKKEQNE